MYGFVPVKLPRLLSKLLEKVLGCDAFPAKSGNEENSIENDTKASSGIPALDGGELLTDIVKGCFGGPTLTLRATHRVVQSTKDTKENTRVMLARE